MTMTRIIFSISAQDKQWLEDTAHNMNISMAEVIRRALISYKHNRII